MGTDAAALKRMLRQVVAEDSADLHTVTSADGRYQFVSAAGLGPFGWVPADMVGQQQEAFTHPDDVSLLTHTRRDAIRDRATPVTTICRLRCSDGTFRWTEIRSRVVGSGSDELVVSNVRDIAGRRRSEINLRRQASTDPLTGIANRTVFMDRLGQALRHIERNHFLVGVLFLDLDRFKLVNDSLGHLTGDAVLSQMAERLRNVLRPQDTLARLGGDEFAIVVEDLAKPEEAAALAARVVDAGRQPFVIGNDQFVCTTSIGIAVTGDPGRRAEDLLQEADLALYRAKDRGRDRADVFDEELRTTAVGRLGTERMLRRAIDENRLRVQYQPIIDVASGETVAVESLVRIWDDDRSVLIAAEEFIQVAEETGLLASMDDRLLIEVVAQAARWRTELAGSNFADVSINVTARHLADAGFAQSVVGELGAHQLPPSMLQIEVTERVLLEASNSAMGGLRTLRQAGVKVGLDDFGTGYSSLSYLRLFPLDFVKIDRSFVQGLVLGATEAAIVASVIDLSHALGMAVVAEGVETKEQLDTLAHLGCDRAQGFYFAAAGSAEKLTSRLTHLAHAESPEGGTPRASVGSK
jgi:diguanylate cyclase (GGDEF)-like protein/PAS domain S-box-containing protein